MLQVSVSYKTEMLSRQGTEVAFLMHRIDGWNQRTCRVNNFVCQLNPRHAKTILPEEIKQT